MAFTTSCHSQYVCMATFYVWIWSILLYVYVVFELSQIHFSVSVGDQVRGGPLGTNIWRLRVSMNAWTDTRLINVQKKRDDGHLVELIKMMIDFFCVFV